MSRWAHTPRALVAVLLASACGGEEPAGEGVPDPVPGPDVAAPALPAPPPDTTWVVDGMMVYLADAAAVTECGTGAAYPVAMEGAYAALERAYLDARPGPGEPLRVTVAGRVSLRPGMEGPEALTLVVDSVLAVHPGEGCGGARPDAPLERTPWTLATLGDGTPLPPDAEAGLLLDPEQGGVSGSTGCNRFTGTYALAGGRLTFGLTATTRMACPPHLLAVEEAFLEALRVTGSYRLRGHVLELLGEAAPVARLEAR